MNIKPKKEYKHGNRKGQAILFAVVGVTIALAVGVTVASRNLSSISRISRGDTSERAFAAAEGGIEKLLFLSGSQLVYLSTGATAATCALVNGTVTADGYCRITYPTASGDPITSIADVKVEIYSSNEQSAAGTSFLTTEMNNGDVSEINLRSSSGKYSGNITLCWEDPAAAIYYSLNNYYDTCDCSKGALRSSDDEGEFPHTVDISDSGFNTVSSTKPGFPYCQDFDLTSTKYDSLRIRALYKKTLVGIFASPALPDQGYKLVSLGRINNQTEVVKKVVAYRTYPFMPSIFDAAIFSPAGQVN